MKCENCNNAIARGSRFCDNCGSPVIKEQKTSLILFRLIVVIVGILGVFCVLFVGKREYGDNDIISDSVNESSDTKAYAYSSPEKITKSPKDTLFELDKEYYSLPCPINEFVVNGWETIDIIVSEVEPLSEVPNCIVLKKDDSTIYVSVYNGDKEKTMKPTECLVSGVIVYLSDYVEEGYLTLSGGISNRTNKDEIIEKIKNKNYLFEEDDGYTSFKFSNDEKYIYIYKSDDMKNWVFEIRNTNM